MARVLLAWELGANFGHISGLAPIASELLGRGHEVIAALSDIQESPRFLSPDVQLLQAPRFVLPRASKAGQPRPQPPRTYCDVLNASGYEDPDQLATMVRSWRALLRLIGPDLVVYESAPTALLASRGLTFRKVGFGSGYSVPPRVSPLPAFLPQLGLPFAEAEKRERQLVQAINEALARSQIPAIRSMSEVFELDATLIKSVPELDQYGERSDVDYVGPSYTLDTGGEVDFPAGDAPRVFLYLRPPHAGAIDAVINELVRAPLRVIAVLPTASNEQIARLRLPHVKASTRPAKLDKLTRSAELAVCHSAVGTGAAFLFAGVPLVLLPTTLEQEMSAWRVAQSGAGVILPANQPVSIASAIERALARTELRENARKLAQRYGAEGEASRVRLVCDRIEQTLERGGS